MLLETIPVAWLNSGLCPDRPKGWIPIIIIVTIIMVLSKTYEIIGNILHKNIKFLGEIIKLQITYYSYHFN